jgi:diguanylate cyclase (GGDEF)-like protein
VRVLIADDDATSRLVLKAAVSKLGHECRIAGDGSSAWEELATSSIDVLLTDWMMPGLEGIELCRRVRQELSGRYVYIVLVTGLGDPEQVLQGMQSGADDYLVKPVDPFALRTRLVAAERVTSLHRQVAHFRDQLERANLELLQRSLTDALTGLGNRRRMEEDLERTHARAQRVGRPYAMAIFDIDYFKLFNDHYGHPAGDQALRAIAHCLDMTVRAGEAVYRYGGEEFLLLLQDATHDEAVVVAERICQHVVDEQLQHETRPTEPPIVTVSGGVASWHPGSTSSSADVLERADKALFVAKAAGRGCVRVAREDSAA